MNQFKNAMYDIQSLEKDFYLGVLAPLTMFSFIRHMEHHYWVPP